MLASIAIILGFQIAGEIISRVAHLPVPGPVLGMVLMLLASFAQDRIIGTIRPTAGFLLSNLSLLFVPAGVGIMRHGERFLNEGAAIMATIVLSTLIAMAASAYVILGVMKLMKISDEEA